MAVHSLGCGKPRISSEFTLRLKAQSLEQQAQTAWITEVKQPTYAWDPMRRVNDTLAYSL
jgi:hypothetical protein